MDGIRNWKEHEFPSVQPCQKRDLFLNYHRMEMVVLREITGSILDTDDI